MPEYEIIIRETCTKETSKKVTAENLEDALKKLVEPPRRYFISLNADRHPSKPDGDVYWLATGKLAKPVGPSRRAYAVYDLSDIERRLEQSYGFREVSSAPF